MSERLRKTLQELINGTPTDLLGYQLLLQHYHDKQLSHKVSFLVSNAIPEAGKVTFPRERMPEYGKRLYALLNELTSEGIRGQL